MKRKRLALFVHSSFKIALSGLFEFPRSCVTTSVYSCLPFSLNFPRHLSVYAEHSKVDVETLIFGCNLLIPQQMCFFFCLLLFLSHRVYVNGAEEACTSLMFPVWLMRNVISACTLAMTPRVFCAFDLTNTLRFQRNLYKSNTTRPSARTARSVHLLHFQAK